MSLATRITALAQAIGTDIKALFSRALPAGGSTGQVLAKSSAANYAVGWESSPVHAWCNFNGNGAPSIRGSKNVASVSYSAGLYRLTFANNAPNVNYAVSLVAVKTGGSGNRRMVCDELVKTTAYCEFKLTSTGSGTATNDSDLVDVIVSG